MSDPVASKSTFLCMYMTNHPDTLVAYVKHFGKVLGNVSSAEMKSIDCKVNCNTSLVLTSKPHEDTRYVIGHEPFILAQERWRWLCPRQI